MPSPARNTAQTDRSAGAQQRRTHRSLCSRAQSQQSPWSGTRIGLRMRKGNAPQHRYPSAKQTSKARLTARRRFRTRADAKLPRCSAADRHFEAVVHAKPCDSTTTPCRIRSARQPLPFVRHKGSAALCSESSSRYAPEAVLQRMKVPLEKAAAMAHCTQQQEVQNGEGRKGIRAPDTDQSWDPVRT